MIDAHLVIRDDAGAEVTRVSLYGHDPALTGAIANRIRRSLRDGYHLDYPQSDSEQDERVFFGRKADA